MQNRTVSPIMDMEVKELIRRAEEKDLAGINRLLHQVNDVHAAGRPDLFTPGGKKYTDEELLQILRNDRRPVFVCTDDQGRVEGYAFCIWQNNYGSRNTLYIDDLCVDEQLRGRRIGSRLYEHVVAYARENDCYHITLNVWCLNEPAIKFYEACGLTPLKIVMEKIL